MEEMIAIPVSEYEQIENYVAFHFPMMGISREAREEIEKIK